MNPIIDVFDLAPFRFLLIFFSVNLGKNKCLEAGNIKAWQRYLDLGIKFLCFVRYYDILNRSCDSCACDTTGLQCDIA